MNVTLLCDNFFPLTLTNCRLGQGGDVEISVFSNSTNLKCSTIFAASVNMNMKDALMNVELNLTP